MNNDIDNSYYEAYNTLAEDQPAETPAMKFSRKEIVLSFAAFVLGYLLIKLLLAPLFSEARLGLGAAVYLILLCVFGLVFPNKRRKITAGAVLRIILITAFSVNVFLSDNVLIQLLDIIFVHIVFAYHMLVASNEAYFGGIRRMFVFDFFRSLFSQPIENMGCCPKAIKSAANSSSAGKGVKYAVIGLIAAIPSTILVGRLLMSADDNFAAIIEGILDGAVTKVIINLLQLFIGIPAACYIFGMCFSSARGAEIPDDEHSLSNVRSLEFAPAAVGVFSAAPVCVLYVIFFFSQLSYFISAFASKLPEGFSYAEYARQGFFELFGVTVINVVIICALNLFCRRGSGSSAIKALTFVLCIFTLMLIATAVSKMVMYIDNYGLTLLRVYTTWFMLLIAMIFMAVLVYLFNRRINLPKISVIIFTVMFALLSFCNVDGMIAGYNIERYIQGKGECDIAMMKYELSASVVPYAADLMNYLEQTGKDDIKLYDELDKLICEKSGEMDEEDIRTYNLPEIIASTYPNYTIEP